MKMIDVFIKFGMFGSGFLFKLYEKNKLPFATVEEICDLDMDYAFNWAAEKSISPLLQYYVDTQDDTFGGVINTIAARFYNKWQKIYDAISADYKAIENFNLTENFSETISSEQTSSQNTRLETNDDTENGAYGFDSQAPVGTTNQIKRITVEGSEDDNRTFTEDTRDRSYTVDKHGNIGTISSQRLIQQELELRRYDFFRQIFKDLDSVLTLKFYEM